MNKQQGFSLFEVLIAMLIAAVGIAAVMGVHNANLRHVRDHAQLNQAQLILNNTVYRLQQKADAGDKTPLNLDTDLVGAIQQITPQNNGSLVQISWPAHDAADAVVRSGCPANVTAGYHCLAMWVAP